MGYCPDELRWIFFARLTRVLEQGSWDSKCLASLAVAHQLEGPRLCLQHIVFLGEAQLAVRSMQCLLQLLARMQLQPSMYAWSTLCAGAMAHGLGCVLKSTQQLSYVSSRPGNMRLDF